MMSQFHPTPWGTYMSIEDEENMPWSYGSVAAPGDAWHPATSTRSSSTTSRPSCAPTLTFSRTTKGPTTFPRFTDLPREIRSRIWSLAMLSFFTNPTGMTMTTLDLRHDRNIPGRVLDSEHHILIAPSVAVLSASREAYVEGGRAIRASCKIVGLRILLGRGVVGDYYRRTWPRSSRFDYVSPLLPGVETVAMDIPRLAKGETVFSSRAALVGTLKRVAGDGMKRLCLGAALFGDPLYTSSIGETSRASEDDGRTDDRYGMVTTVMVHRAFERGLKMIPVEQMPVAVVQGCVILARNEQIKMDAQKTGREFIEIARVGRDEEVAVVGDLPDRGTWGTHFEEELVPIMRVLRDEFPLLEAVHVMTESQRSVLATFEALRCQGGSGGLMNEI